MKRLLLLCGLVLLVQSSTGKVNEKSQQQQRQKFERIEQQSVPIEEVPVSVPADNAAVLSSTKNTGAGSSWNRGNSYVSSGNTMITYNPVKYSVKTSFRNPGSFSQNNPAMVQGAVQQVSRTVTYRDVEVPTIRVNRPPMQIEIGGNSGGSSFSNGNNQLHILFKSNSGSMFEPFGGSPSAAKPDTSVYVRSGGQQQPARRVMTITSDYGSNPAFDYSQYMRPVKYTTHVIKPMSGSSSFSSSSSSSGRQPNAQQQVSKPFFQSRWQAGKEGSSQVKGIQMQAGQMYELPTQTRMIGPSGFFSSYSSFVSSPTAYNYPSQATTVKSGKSAFEAAREILGDQKFDEMYGNTNIVTASKPLVLNRQTGGGTTHFIQPPSAQRYSSSSSNSYSSYSSSSSSNYGPNAGSTSKTAVFKQSFNSALPPAEQNKQSVYVSEVQVKPAPVHVVQPTPPVFPSVPAVQPVAPVVPVSPVVQPAFINVPVQRAQVYNQRQQEVYNVQPFPQQQQQQQVVQQTFKPFVPQSSRYQQQTGSYSIRPVQQQQQQQFFQQSVPLESIPVENVQQPTAHIYQQQQQQQQLTAAQPLALAVLQNPVYRIPVETVSTNTNVQQSTQVVPVFQTTRTVQVRPLVQETHLITPQTQQKTQSSVVTNQQEAVQEGKTAQSSSSEVERSSSQFTTSVQQQPQPAPAVQAESSVSTFDQSVQQQPAPQPAPLAPYPQPQFSTVTSTNVQQTIAEPVVFGSKVQTKFVQEDALQQQQQQTNSVASSSTSSGEEEARIEEAVPAVAPVPVEVPVVSFTSNNNVDKSTVSNNNRAESSVEYAQEAEDSNSTGASEEPIVEYNKLKEKPQQPAPQPQYKPLPQFQPQQPQQPSTAGYTSASSQTSSVAQSESQNQVGGSSQTTSVQQQQPLPYGTRLVQPVKPFDQQVRQQPEQTEQIQQSYLTGEEDAVVDSS